MSRAEPLQMKKDIVLYGLQLQLELLKNQVKTDKTT